MVHRKEIMSGMLYLNILMIRGEVGTRKYQPSGTLGGTGRPESQEKKRDNSRKRDERIEK